MCQAEESREVSSGWERGAWRTMLVSPEEWRNWGPLALLGDDHIVNLVQDAVLGHDITFGNSGIGHHRSPAAVDAQRTATQGFNRTHKWPVRWDNSGTAEHICWTEKCKFPLRKIPGWAMGNWEYDTLLIVRIICIWLIWLYFEPLERQEILCNALDLAIEKNKWIF